MTRLLLALALLACCAGCAANNVGGGLPLAVSVDGGRSVQQAESAAPAVVTIQWTMPVLKATGDPLPMSPLDWQAAYSTQSATWRNHAYWMKYNPDTLAFYWSRVVAEAAPLPVWTATAMPGSRVEWNPPPVVASAWPFSWWIRTRQRPAGEWSLWSNPVTRADNQ